MQMKRKPARWIIFPRTTLLALGALIVLSVCSDQPSVQSGVDRSSRGDTTWIVNHGPAHADTAQLREVGRIGLQQGSSEYVFARINALMVGSDGSLFVSDEGRLLRQYDRRGEYVRTVAREGAGPGEIRYVVGLAVLPDGRLAARDLGNGRISVFDEAGNFSAQWTNPEGQPGYGGNAITVDTSGSIYVGVNPPLPSDDTPLTFPRPIFVKLTSDGEVTDTLFADARFTEDCPFQSRRWFRSGWFEDLRVHYLPKVKWAVARTGDVIVGCPASYAFDIISPSGAVTRVSRDWEPVVVSDEELGNYVDGQAISRSSSGYFDSWEWEGPDLSNSLPAYQRFVPADDGRIWVWPGLPRVRRETPEQFVRAGYPAVYWEDPMTGAFDVFEADGRFVGSVALPPDMPYTFYPATPDPFIRGDTVWAITVDSLEVQYVSIFEIAWPAKTPDDE